MNEAVDAQRLSEIERKLAELTALVAQLTVERDHYRKLYLDTLERCRKLEQGIIGPKRERLPANDAQLAMSVLAMLQPQPPVGGPDAAASVPATAAAAAALDQAPERPRAPPTGRKPLPEKLPRVDIEVLPPEVQEAGLAAFDRISEDVTETVERRPSSLVVVRVHRPKFAPKGRDRAAETTILQAAPPELPIPRGLAGPTMLANTVVRRWQEHQPLHRMERIYGREGLELARSTICGWHAELAVLVGPLVDAMWKDARTAPYLCTDATGVLVQAKEKCRRGHFWVVIAPERHVLFAYSAKHDGAAVDKLLDGYKGYLVSDAASVYDHLFLDGGVLSVGCWSHARRYFFKALDSDPDRARHALGIITGLFLADRRARGKPPDEVLALRQAESKPLVTAFFEWCDAQVPVVLDETPIAKAVGYARNQRAALERFLTDGRLPLHNNWSERELRRECVGRKNWLFVGSDDGGEVNAAFVTLLASCQLHGIEPSTYLRDLFCLLPGWPKRRVLELSPAHWKQTLQDEDAQQALAANVFRQVVLAPVAEHPPIK